MVEQLVNLAKKNALNPGDFLLCYANGGYAWDDTSPMVGYGEEGLDSLQKINEIMTMSIDTTDDDDYFKKNGEQLTFMSNELNQSTSRELWHYVDIWENAYFLRIFAQLANLINHDHYDWRLSVYGETRKGGRTTFIREHIVKRLVEYPTIHAFVKEAAVSQLRNAIAHAKYHIVPGGILLDNYNDDKYATLQGVTFEQWERIYIHSIALFRIILSFLRQYSQEYKKKIDALDMPGYPILIPSVDGQWSEAFIRPNEDATIWRFIH